MMKNFKRWLSCSLAAVLTVGMLAGCGSDAKSSEPTTSAGSTTVAAEETAAKYDEKIEISSMVVAELGFESSDDFTNENGEFFDKRWKIITDKFNVKVNYVKADWGSYQEKLRLALASNDLPDVTMSFLDVKEYFSYVDQGVIKTLPSGFEEKYPNIKRAYESVTARDALKRNGQYYAIPRPLDIGGINSDYARFITYRKDLAQQAGVEIKDAYTVEDLYNMFSAVQKKFPELTVYSHIWPDQMWSILGIRQFSDQFDNGFYLNEASGQYEYAPADPKLVEGIKWFKKFYDAGFMNKEYLTLPAYEARNEFNNGKVFSYYDGVDILMTGNARAGFKKQNPSMDENEAVDVALLLNSENKHVITDSGNYWSEFIFNSNISDEKFDRFCAVLDYLYSDEGIDLVNFGIEGEHFKRNGDQIEILRATDPETGAFMPFNKNANYLDSGFVLFDGPHAGTSISLKNPVFAEKTKERIKFLFEKRMNEPHIINKYDAKKVAFEGPNFLKYSLKPGDEINRIVISKKADEVEAEWKKWLNDNNGTIQAILDELNAK